MGLATLGIAVLYLLTLVAVGALLGLVWLFGEAPGEGTRTGRESFGGSTPSIRSCYGSSSVPADPMHPLSSPVTVEM